MNDMIYDIICFRCLVCFRQCASCHNGPWDVGHVRCHPPHSPPGRYSEFLLSRLRKWNWHVYLKEMLGCDLFPRRSIWGLCCFGCCCCLSGLYNLIKFVFDYILIMCSMILEYVLCYWFMCLRFGLWDFMFCFVEMWTIEETPQRDIWGAVQNGAFWMSDLEVQHRMRSESLASQCSSMSGKLKSPSTSASEIRTYVWTFWKW